MNRKRYCSPVVCVFHVRAAHTLLSGSPTEGTQVVPGEYHDPSEAGSRRRKSLWDDPDEEDDSGWDNL